MRHATAGTRALLLQLIDAGSRGLLHLSERTEVVERYVDGCVAPSIRHLQTTGTTYKPRLTSIQLKKLIHKAMNISGFTGKKEIDQKVPR